MLHRLWILVLLQLSNHTKAYDIKSKRKYVHFILRALIIILITAVIGFLYHVIKDILYIPVNEYFMIFLILLTQVMSIVTALVGLSTDIYNSKDNQILLTMPAKNDEIYFSKLIVYYRNEFLKNLYLIVPLLLSYGIYLQVSFAFYIFLIPIIFILPMLSVLIASILSIVISFIHHYLSRHAWLTFAVSLLGIGLLFYVVYQIVDYIPDNIRIVQLYNSFIFSLTRFMVNVSSFGFVYTSIGKLLNSVNILVNILIILGYVIGLFVLNYLVARPLFFRLTSNASEQARTKKHRVKTSYKKGLFFTFFRKEITIAKRSPNELLNNYAVLFLLPIVMFVLNSIYMNMNRSTLGNEFVLIFNIFITLILITMANTASAVAITTEGQEFVLLKTAPSNTMQVAWAKMAFNFIVTSILILISFILFELALPVFNKTDIWLLFAFVFFFNASHILWSFQIDILSPKLSDYASTGTLSNNDNIAKSLSNGFIFSLFATVMAAIVFTLFPGWGWPTLITFIILWFLFRLKSFIDYLNAYFRDIEY